MIKEKKMPRSWVLHATILVLFLYLSYLYQSKFFTYYLTRTKDNSVFHELCDLYCLIGVRVLSYRSSEFEFDSDRLAN